MLKVPGRTSWIGLVSTVALGACSGNLPSLAPVAEGQPPSVLGIAPVAQQTNLGSSPQQAGPAGPVPTRAAGIAPGAPCKPCTIVNFRNANVTLFSRP
jgi:hypothetical protein